MGNSNVDRLAEINAELGEINTAVLQGAKSVRMAALDLAKNLIELASRLESNEHHGCLPSESDLDRNYTNGWLKHEVERLKQLREKRDSFGEEHRVLRHKIAQQERKVS